MEKEITNQNLKDAVAATIKGMINWIKSDNVVCQDKTTRLPIPNSEIESINSESIMDNFIVPELLKVGIIYTTEEEATNG